MNDDRRDGAGRRRRGTKARRTLTIVNARGLHARAAAKFVRCAEMFNAEIKVTRQDQTVSGCSIMGLLLLTAAPGADIEVSARGPEAGAAVEALATLVANGFEED